MSLPPYRDRLESYRQQLHLFCKPPFFLVSQISRFIRPVFDLAFASVLKVFVSHDEVDVDIKSQRSESDRYWYSECD